MKEGDRVKLMFDGDSFFFQAEDGIRDTSVTGVQTCALPISVIDFKTSGSSYADHEAKLSDQLTAYQIAEPEAERSEERRVGKECRYRREPQHKKRNTKKDKQTGTNQSMNRAEETSKRKYSPR